ncbi:putative sulfatase [Algoriphagus boseongensis]|uniref:Putative sulfatase n=1 Tax=Algoriphagus boseongensis TaxID=1442587 RepID=A0A4R6T6Y0_9BACT|nr:LTA synthase family protein [Algoriphagus boseongensis]TDQ18740.1 putative sulfatase [Algoriphagus boseongensis]
MAQKAEIRSTFTDRVKNIFADFWGMSLIFVLLMLILRAVEIVMVFQNHILTISPNEIIPASYYQDLGWTLYFLGLLFIIHLFLSFISPKFSRILMQVILTLALVIQMALIFYFVKTLLPLGKDLFAYNFNDLYLTVSASGQLNMLNVILGILAIILLGGLLYLGIKIFKFGLKTYLTFTGVFLILLLSISIFPSPLPEGANETKRNLELNKSRFLAEQTFDYLVYGGEYYFDFYLRSNDLNFFVKKEYTNSEYPFMHKADYPDVLGPFFDSLDQAPDIVFILAESFGKAYSGTGSYLGSFTPFLDSLEQHSLVWTHAISSTGRTFGILPGIMAGLPYGEKGFLELYDEYPYHNSFLSILKNNGYQTRFFIGSDRKFDHEGDFLEYQGIDQLEDESTFLPQFSRTPSRNGFSWGYADKELFQNGLLKLPKEKQGPEVRIFQTQTSHDPYIVPEREKYLVKFNDHLRNYLNLSSSQIQEYSAYQEIYMTILYADDAIKMFFEEYSKRPEFENTIFIITGDHRLPEIPMASRLDRFHVPLIIYSPKLKEGKIFKGMSSHFEVTPTLLAFLEKNAGIQVPEEVIWQGQVLDTASNFQAKIAMPLMRNKNQLLDYLNGEFFLSDGQLFLITEGLNIDPVQDNDVTTRLIGEFEEFKNKNSYTVETRKLLSRPTSQN